MKSKGDIIMSELFAGNEVAVEEGKRALPGAAILKAEGIQVATSVMAAIKEKDEEVIALVKDSQSSLAVAEELARKYTQDLEVLKSLDDDDIKRLLKSNQSNASRRKAMPMTQGNYMEYLASVAATVIIRDTLGMAKGTFGAGGGTRSRGPLTDEDIAELANDQEALGRKIRVIQSNKSVFKKNNPDNYADTEEWAALLDIEAKLMAVRTTGGGSFGQKGVSLKKAIAFILNDVDISKANKDTLVDTLQAIVDATKGDYPAEYMAQVEVELAEKAAKEAAKANDEEEVYED